MTRPDVVLVPLDRGEARYIWDSSVHGGLLVEEETSDALRAALDTDREELIERLARHMHPEAWPELYPGKDWRRDKARENAQAVLALLEGADDE